MNVDTEVVSREPVPVLAVGDETRPADPAPAPLNLRPYLSMLTRPAQTSAALLAQPQAATSWPAVMGAVVVADLLRSVLGGALGAPAEAVRVVGASVCAMLLVTLMTHGMARLVRGQGGWARTAQAVVWGTWVKSALMTAAGLVFTLSGSVIPHAAAASLTSLVETVAFLIAVWVVWSTLRVTHALSAGRALTATLVPLLVVLVAAVVLAALMVAAGPGLSG